MPRIAGKGFLGFALPLLAVSPGVSSGQSCIQIVCASWTTAAPGDTTGIRFGVVDCESGTAIVTYETFDSEGWFTPSTGTLTIAPTDTAWIEVGGVVPDDASCTVGTSVSANVFDTSAALVAACSTFVQRYIESPFVTCSGADSIVHPGDSFPSLFCIHNPSRASRTYHYGIADVPGWCGGSQSGDITIAPGDSACFPSTCEIPLNASCGTTAVHRLLVVDPCSNVPNLYFTCQQIFTVTAEICMYPECSTTIDTVITVGATTRRKFGWQNCAATEQTFDYAISDSLGWGMFVSGSVVLAPEERATAWFTLDAPGQAQCAVTDAITLRVGSRACPDSAVTCTRHVSAEPAASGTAGLVLAGGSDDRSFGRSLAMPGDLNGDGVEDWAIGAASYSASDPGHVSIFFGGTPADGTPDLTMAGENNGDFFGLAVAAAGDLNGDGSPDLAVGAPSNGAAGLEAGRVYVYFGGTTLDAQADLVLDGPAPQSAFGLALDGAGDLNGDGFDDLVVGAASALGRAYVYFGGPGMDTNADVVLAGVGYEGFGRRVAGAGDLNADGWNDLLVSAPMNATAGPSAGAVYVYWGGPDLDPQADLMLLGAGGGFGSALCATDLDGDGSQDVLVGAPLVGGVTGRVYVFRGGSQFDSQADRVLASGIPAENFGCALAAAGDLDGDGFGDLVVGAVSSNYYDPGRAWIVLGGPHLDDACDGVLDGPADANGFGQTVAAGRDVDHDGRPDVLVGSPELPAYTSYAYLFTDVHPTATDRPEPIESRQADLRPWIGLPVDRGAAGVQIEYSIGPRACEAELALFDVAGRRLRILATGVQPAGRSRVSWDRTTANGARVARGVYILRLRAGGLEAQRKLVLVRP